MRKNSDSRIVSSDNNNEREEVSALHQNLCFESEEDTRRETLALISYRPPVSSFPQLVLLQPAELFSHIQSLESRVTELTIYNDTLQRENEILQRLVAGIRRTSLSGTPEESVLVLQVSTNSGTSTHEVFAQPRFGFPNVASVSLTDVRNSTQLVIIPSTPSATTAISSPGLTVMYLRKGVEPECTTFACTNSSSHELVILQRPVFCQTELSDTSISDSADSVCYVTMRTSISSAFILKDIGSRGIATYSLPHIVTFPSIVYISDDTEHDSEENEIATKIHYSQSWPCYRRPYLTDFTMFLAGCLDEDTDSDFELNEEDETEDTNTEINSNGSALSSHSDNETNNASEGEEPGSGSDQANDQPSVTEIVNTHTISRNEEPNSSGYTSTIVEHPFIEPLRSIYEDRVLRTLFASNAEVQRSEIVPSGLQLSRRRAITILPIREFGIYSWARTIRAQLFLNVNLATVLENNDETVDTESTGSINSMENEASDMNLPDMSEVEEGDGEQIEALNPNDHVDLEEEDPVGQADAGNTSSSSDDSGQGDAEIVDSSSSTTSMSSHAFESSGRQSPTFPYPSESNLGGKYGCLRAAIRRPRAPDGHRFVVSVFGSTGRKNNELNLPSWVPVYADRLECILNQFLERSNSNNKIGPVMQILHSASRNQSEHSYRSVVTCTASQENRFEQVGLSTSSRHKQLKSCLRMSREGSTGETIPKNLSWSQNIVVRNVDPLSMLSIEIDNEINSNDVTEGTNSIPSRTRSCPDVLLNCRMDETSIDENKKATLKPSEVEISATLKKTKKKSIVLKFLETWCSCCNCSSNLKNSSSQDYTQYTT